jgi:hypothetical protein
MNVTHAPSTSSMRPCLSSLRRLAMAVRPAAARSSGLAAHAAQQQPALQLHGFKAHRQLSTRGLSAAAQSALQQQPRPSRSAVAASAAAPAVTDQPPAAAPAGQQQQHAGSNGASSQAGASTAPTFQEAVQRLQNYWAAQGCIVWLPHNTEVGAGTMNPATFLR